MHLADCKEFTAIAAITPLQYSTATWEKRGSKDMNWQKENKLTLKPKNSYLMNTTYFLGIY